MRDKVMLGPENFWTKRTTKDVYRRKMELVQLLSFYYNQALLRKKRTGSAEFELSLLSLRNMVRDYQPAFNFFFEIVSKGYRLSNNDRELTMVVPKRHDFDIVANYIFSPDERPDSGVISKVYVKQDRTLIDDVTRAGHITLIPKIKFLMDGPGEFNFMFEPCGDLGLRDTCTWPIPGIEIWPSWIRHRLFGGTVDIKSAYIQFVVQQLTPKYGDKSKILFDKIFTLWEQPDKIRKQVCDVLKVDYSSNRTDVKRLLMSVAMGSKVSPSLVFHDMAFCTCATLINKIQPGISEEQAQAISDLLTPISAQFKFAKSSVDTSMPTYFKWERERRYILWELCDRHGIMMHDGLDGVPTNYLQDLGRMDLGFDISWS